MATLEQALPHARYRAIALYDARGEVLHCTSTDFGIEFRQALNDALDAFVLGAARESRFLRGEGTRTAVMLALGEVTAFDVARARLTVTPTGKAWLSAGIAALPRSSVLQRLAALVTRTAVGNLRSLRLTPLLLAAS